MPPIPLRAPPLNGIKKGTFVYDTIKDRWPAILTKVIDQVTRYRHTHVAVFPQNGDADIKGVIHELSEMRYQMITDKPIVNVNDSGENAQIWNAQLEEYRKKEKEENVTWYRTDWLFVECYLYRRIAGAFMKTTTLNFFDPFSTQKQNAYVDSIPAMEAIANYLLSLEKEETAKTLEEEAISEILQICLWGNKFDLSLSGGRSTFVEHHSPLKQVKELAPKILVNQISDAIRILKGCESQRIDIALDNAGLELFGDLAFAEFLITKWKIAKVVFHGKTIPWFVSDVNGNDFCWLTEMLRGSHIESLNTLGHRWHKRISQGEFEFQSHSFWTLPFPYWDMPKYAADLYEHFSKSGLIFFKGDLHYRKLVGDREWPFDTPFKVALQGFGPAPLLALRTLKAETQVGLSAEVISRITKQYGEKKTWMVTGEYAVAQFSE